MRTLISEPELRGMFDIHKDVEDSRLTPAIRAASRRLRSMIGDAAYTDASGDTPVDQDRKEDCQYAEAVLAMHYALTGLNTQVRAQGVVKSEKQEGQVIVQFLSPKEMGELAGLYLDQAEEIIRPYKSDELPATAEIVETDDAAC